MTVLINLLLFLSIISLYSIWLYRKYKTAAENQFHRMALSHEMSNQLKLDLVHVLKSKSNAILPSKVNHGLRRLTYSTFPLYNRNLKGSDVVYLLYKWIAVQRISSDQHFDFHHDFQFYNASLSLKNFRTISRITDFYMNASHEIKGIHLSRKGKQLRLIISCTDAEKVMEGSKSFLTEIVHNCTYSLNSELDKIEFILKRN